MKKVRGGRRERERGEEERERERRGRGERREGWERELSVFMSNTCSTQSHMHACTCTEN